MKSHLLPTLLVAALATAPVRAAESSPTEIEQRLTRLEAALARIEARLGDTISKEDLAPTRKELGDLAHQLGYDGKTPLTVVKAGGKEQKLSIGGFVHAHAEFGDAIDSRYAGIYNRVLVRRARLTVKSSFQENFEFTLQPDFGNNGIAGNTAYRGGLADAYVAWNKYEAATVQLGQFKTPFGYEQLTSDSKTLTVERSLPNDLLTVSRQIGVGVLGTVLDKRVTYSAGAFNGNGVNNGNNDNDQFMYAGRATATAWSHGGDKLTIGANGFWSNDAGTFTGHRTGRAVDAQLTLGRFDFQAEHLSVLQNRLAGADTTADGWYGLVGYFIIPKTLQALVRYETYDANVRLAGQQSKSWVFGGNYFLKGDDLKFTFNYVLGDPAGPASHVNRFMSRLQVVF